MAKKMILDDGTTIILYWAADYRAINGERRRIEIRDINGQIMADYPLIPDVLKRCATNPYPPVHHHCDISPCICT